MNRSLSSRSRRRSKLLRAVCPLFAAGLMTLGSSGARASNYYWDPTQTASTTGFGSGTWDKTLLNFYNGAADVAWADGNTAIFGGTAGTYAVNLGVPISALNIQFTSSGYTVTSTATNTLTLTGGFGTAGAGATVYSSGAGTNTIAGPITIAATPNNSTPAYFSAASGSPLSLTGTITQNAAATSANSIGGGGTVNYSGSGFATGKFNVVGGTVFNTSGTMTGFTGTYAGVSDTTAGTTWNINAGSSISGGSATLFLGNAAGASGAVNMNGGTATFTAINVGNNFNNGTDTASTGVLTVAGGTLTDSGALRLGGGLGSGTLFLTGGNFSIAGTIAKGVVGTGNTGGSATINFNGGTLTLTGTSTTAVNSVTANVQGGGAKIDSATANTITSALVSGVGAGNTDGGLTKTGAGVLTLGGVNTYNGPTSITGGLAFANTAAQTLVGNISGAARWPRAARARRSSAGPTAASRARSRFPLAPCRPTRRMRSAPARCRPPARARAAARCASTAASPSPTPSADSPRATIPPPTASVPHIENVSGANTISSNLAVSSGGGSGGIIQSDAGTLTLSGTLSNTSASTFSRPFYLTGAGNGVVGGNILVGAANNPTSIIKEGAGTWTLSGTANTYSGGTTVSGGILTVAANNALGTGNVSVGAGAALTLNSTVVLTNQGGATLTLDGTATVNLLAATPGTVQDTVGTLVVGGVTEQPGTYGSAASGAPNTLSQLTGNGVIVVTVPEPSTWALMAGGFGGLVAMMAYRRRGA